MAAEPTSPASMSRYAPFAVILCLWSAPAFAQAPAASNPEQGRRGEVVSETFKADVQAAVELRHRRLLLQQRRIRGEISEAEFAAQDKKALGGIMAIRGKYARKGERDSQNFYRELETKTWTDPENPPPAPAGSGGTSPADFQHDAGLAAKLMIERRERSSRYSARDAQTSSEADRPLLVEWMRLREKWHAEGSGKEFDRDIGQRSGLPVMPMPFATASTRPFVNPRAMASPWWITAAFSPLARPSCSTCSTAAPEKGTRNPRG